MGRTILEMDEPGHGPMREVVQRASTPTRSRAASASALHALRRDPSLLPAALERLPDLRVDPDAPPLHVAGLALRSPPALPARFTLRP